MATPGSVLSMTSYQSIRDLTDEEARRSLVLKWGTADPDVLPAWVAEMRPWGGALVAGVI